MLTNLSIRNLAIIDSLSIDFHRGLNVLTGETAAGKSIIIDSINMVLGEKTSKDKVREGTERATVSAMFTVDNDETLNAIESLGIEAEDGELLLNREITREGKSVCRINGQIATRAMMQELAESLINIHGQHDNQALLSPRRHIEFLDDFAEMNEDLERYKEVYNKACQIQKDIDRNAVYAQERERKIEELTRQVDEIHAAQLTDGEEEELAEQQKILSNGSKIVEGTMNAYQILYGAEQTAYDMVYTAVKHIESVADCSEELAKFYADLLSLSVNLNDIAGELKNYSEAMEFSAEKQDQIEERLNTIYKLRRKYGSTIKEILIYLVEVEKELNALNSSEEILSELQSELGDVLKKQKTLADVLTEKRKVAGQILQQRITDELLDLNMPKVKFVVDIQKCAFNANGADSVEFMISTNPGSLPKNLAKIASGGELSRIMLAIKSVLSDKDIVSSFIFDEIDSGISGRAAQKVAEKMSKIAKDKQVLCVSHLAQIASMADYHYQIVKTVFDEDVKSTVIELEDEEREKEIARILGGAKITGITIANAKEMIELAEQTKENFT